MRQKRFQKGSVRPRKHGKNKVWVAQWWEDGNKKSKVLGRCTTMGKSEAEAAMAVILKPQNEDAGPNSKARVYLRCLPRTGVPADVPPKMEGVHSNDN